MTKKTTKKKAAKASRTRVVIKASKEFEAFGRDPLMMAFYTNDGVFHHGAHIGPQDVGVAWMPGVRYRVTYEIVGFNPGAEKFIPSLFLRWVKNPGSIAEARKQIRELQAHHERIKLPKAKRRFVNDYIKKVDALEAFMKRMPDIQAAAEQAGKFLDNLRRCGDDGMGS